MLTYCVGYKHCFILILNKNIDLYCIIFSNTIILTMDLLSKIYHILFKPAINYNYYADTIQE